MNLLIWRCQPPAVTHLQDKEDIAEMRRMVQETLQRSMELEEENNRLKELLEQS